MKERIYNLKGKVQALSRKSKTLLICVLCIIFVCIGMMIITNKDNNTYVDNSNKSSGITLDEKIAMILYEHLSPCSDDYDIEKTIYSVDAVTEVADGMYDVKGYFVLYRKNSTEKTRALDFEMTINTEGKSYCKSEMVSGRYY